jgi:uncharacterized protein (DUF779 family)
MPEPMLLARITAAPAARGCPFYMDKRLDQAWHQEQFLLDVAPGEPEDFSLAAGDNLHFVTHSPPASVRARPTKTSFPHL